jgi:Domain of unknown function (DUF4037)
MPDIFPETAKRVSEWAEQPEVLGVVLVGSKSRRHADDLSDDDLEVLLTDEAHNRLAPTDCIDVLIEGEGANRKILYDAQYTSLSDLQRKAGSPFDLDHWPYEEARVLFDRNGDVAKAVEAAGRMDTDFRTKRLKHAAIDAWIAIYRVTKTQKRGYDAAARLLVARGVKALSRVVFALEARWVPLDHWWQAELGTLADPEGIGPLLVEALMTSSPEPLSKALAQLEDRLFADGVPRPAGRHDLFMEIIHPTRAEERAIHGM